MEWIAQRELDRSHWFPLEKSLALVRRHLERYRPHHDRLVGIRRDRLINREYFDIAQYGLGRDHLSAIILACRYHVDVIAGQKEAGHTDDVIDANRDSALVF